MTVLAVCMAVAVGSLFAQLPCLGALNPCPSNLTVGLPNVTGNGPASTGGAHWVGLPEAQRRALEMMAAKQDPEVLARATAALQANQDLGARHVALTGQEICFILSDGLYYMDADGSDRNRIVQTSSDFHISTAPAGRRTEARWLGQHWEQMATRISVW